MDDQEIKIRQQHRKLLIEQEGYRQFPYFDSRQILTIGIGRNLKTHGISQSEALIMLDNDIADNTHLLQKYLPVFDSLDEIRKGVLVNMSFNLGVEGILKFRNMIACLAKQDWDGAAQQMLDSEWHEQVGERAIDLAHIMLTGDF
jgi:lysozyme